MRILPPEWHIEIIKEDILPLRSKQHILETAESLGLQGKITEEQLNKLHSTITSEIYDKVNNDPRFISRLTGIYTCYEPDARVHFRRYTSKPLEKEIRSLFEVQEPKSLTSWIWSLFTTSS
ncbi:MAG: hypothetical protein ChlgKO_11070 [Chlamydiales bacterium]